MENLPAETMAELHDAFALFDKDKSDSIPVKDLGLALRAAGTNPTEQDLQDFTSELESVGATVVDFKQFLDFAFRKLSEYISEEELKLAFQTFDKDGLGCVSVTELRIIMCTLGDKLSEDEMNELLQEVDMDIEGNVNYEELCKKLAPERPPTVK
eukprot:GGOE01053235.1.p2 GENE.GGOE01053235.1~~GGOE01053235.1.p2  ORF type:complete len:155 (+),score=60.05 GGOE01053235.1:80-544(+)